MANNKQKLYTAEDKSKHVVEKDKSILEFYYLDKLYGNNLNPVIKQQFIDTKNALKSGNDNEFIRNFQQIKNMQKNFLQPTNISFLNALQKKANELWIKESIKSSNDMTENESSNDMIKDVRMINKTNFPEPMKNQKNSESDLMDGLYLESPHLYKNFEAIHSNKYTSDMTDYGRLIRKTNFTKPIENQKASESDLMYGLYDDLQDIYMNKKTSPKEKYDEAKKIIKIAKDQPVFQKQQGFFTWILSCITNLFKTDLTSIQTIKAVETSIEFNQKECEENSSHSIKHK